MKSLVELFLSFVGKKDVAIFLLNGERVAGQVTGAFDGAVALSYTRAATPANARTGIPAVSEKTFTQWVPFSAIARIVTSEEGGA